MLLHVLLADCYNIDYEFQKFEYLWEAYVEWTVVEWLNNDNLIEV